MHNTYLHLIVLQVNHYKTHGTEDKKMYYDSSNRYY